MAFVSRAHSDSTPISAPPLKATAATRPSLSFAGSVGRDELHIGAIDDPLEREADRIATAVLAGNAVGAVSSAPIAAPQRKCAQCDEEEDASIQRKGSDNSSGRVARSDVAAAAQAVFSGGAQLTPSQRAYFEPRFGRSFSDVRLHFDGAAASAADKIDARAFTLGKDVAFGRGAYRPETAGGCWLLAHELAHVAQQRGTHAPMLQREPKSKADMEREAAIERARAAGAFCTTAQDEAQFDAEEALRLKHDKSNDANYAVLLGRKDRALIQKRQSVSVQLSSEIATKTRFFKDKAKASYLQMVGNAVIDFGGSDAGMVIMETCASEIKIEKPQSSGDLFEQYRRDIHGLNCDIAKREFMLQYEDEPWNTRCMKINTDEEYSSNYFDRNISSAVGYAVPGTTWENVQYDSFHVLLVKYKNGTSEYFVLNDVGDFHYGHTASVILDHLYIKRKNGLVYPATNGKIYFHQNLTPNIISYKNGLKYQVKELQQLYSLLQVGGTFASILGFYGAAQGSFKASIGAFRRTGPAVLPGRPLPGIGVGRSRSSSVGGQTGGAVGGPKITSQMGEDAGKGAPKGRLGGGADAPKVSTTAGEEGAFKGDPKSKTSGRRDPGAKATSTVEQGQSAGDRITTSGGGRGEYRPLSKSPDIGVLEVRDDGSVSIVSANRKDELAPGVMVGTHINLANHANGLGPATEGAARYRFYMSNGKVDNVQPLSRSPQSPERVGEIERALRRNRLLSDRLTIIDLSEGKNDASLKKTIMSR
ncbi:DUF4157 domain-containing protein [Nitrobacter sp.]|uniref:eCIS core domain-containing protein n=1 Tax=unclassified Nitrobacter TaxID=2620411 RepID=UPI00321FEC9F